MGLLKGEYCPRNTEAITSLWKVTTGAGAKVGDVRGVWGDRKIQQWNTTFSDIPFFGIYPENSIQQNLMLFFSYLDTWVSYM